MPYPIAYARKNWYLILLSSRYIYICHVNRSSRCSHTQSHLLEQTCIKERLTSFTRAILTVRRLICAFLSCLWLISSSRSRRNSSFSTRPFSSSFLSMAARCSSYIQYWELLYVTQLNIFPFPHTCQGTDMSHERIENYREKGHF